VFLVSVLYIFGGTTLQDFAFAMLIGIASGTYSSIFIAAPVLTEWKEREPAYRRRRERISEQMGRVPPFPEENVISRLEGEPATEDTEPESPQPTPAAPAPAAPSAVPGVLPEGPPTPAAPPPAPEPEPRAPESAADRGDGDDREDEPAGDQPELSDASAAALRRIQGEGGGKKGRRKRKHGRNR
jgi:SecD/SecF fusion protein